MFCCGPQSFLNFSKTGLIFSSTKYTSRLQSKPFFSNPRYCQIRVILDCAEFEIEAPSALSLNAMTYPDYKGRNMVKVLFGVTPDDYIIFISMTFDGSISDNSITLKSRILDLLEAGDTFMADKGFTLSNSLLQPRGLALVLPFCFAEAEVEETKKISNLLIVVENYIMRTRYFRILCQRTPV